MKKSVFLVAAAILSVVLVLPPLAAHARADTEVILGHQLNGEITKVGVLTSAGTTINNSDTAVPFTIASGNGINSSCPTRTILIDCDAAVNFKTGSTCSSTITDANYGAYIAPHDIKQMVLKNDTTLICIDTTGGAANCAIFCQE